MDCERVVVAEILRPRGNRGEVLATSHTDVPGRLEQLKSATARLLDGSDAPIQIAEAWPHKSNWVLKLENVNSIDAAQRFAGAEIWVPLADRGSLPQGEFFQSDLIGCTVTDASTGRALGAVKALERYGGPPLMQVNVDGRQALIPFVDSICRNVDLAARTITVELPEGLLDL